jgi:hypothetical protein
VPARTLLQSLALDPSDSLAQTLLRQAMAAALADRAPDELLPPVVTRDGREAPSTVARPQGGGRRGGAGGGEPASLPSPPGSHAAGSPAAGTDDGDDDEAAAVAAVERQFSLDGDVSGPLLLLGAARVATCGGGVGLLSVAEVVVRRHQAPDAGEGDDGGGLYEDSKLPDVPDELDEYAGGAAGGYFGGGSGGRYMSASGGGGGGGEFDDVDMAVDDDDATAGSSSFLRATPGRAAGGGGVGSLAAPSPPGSATASDFGGGAVDMSGLTDDSGRGGGR